MGVLDFLNQQKKKLLDSTELDDKVVNFYRSARKTNPQQLYQMLDRDKTTPGTQFFGTNKALDKQIRIANTARKNLTGNISALTNRDTRQDALRGFGYSFGNAGKNIRQSPGYKNINPRIKVGVDPVIDTVGTAMKGVSNVVGGGKNYLQSLPLGNRPSSVGQVKGGLRVLKGFGQVVGSPLAGALSVPRNILPDNQQGNLARRGITGFQRTYAQDESIGSDVKAQQVSINNPFSEEDIKFDPAMALGAMLGFVQNPQNKMLFNKTEKWLSPELGGFTKSNIGKWLARTATRGSIEDIVLDFPEMPEYTNTRDQAEWFMNTALVGASMEIGGQLLMNSGKKVLGPMAGQMNNQMTKGINTFGEWIKTIPESRLAQAFQDVKQHKNNKTPITQQTKELFSQAKNVIKNAMPGDTKLVEFTENGQTHKFTADAETARNWSYRNSQRGIETKVTNIGRQGGFAGSGDVPKLDPLESLKAEAPKIGSVVEYRGDQWEIVAQKGISGDLWDLKNIQNGKPARVAKTDVSPISTKNIKEQVLNNLNPTGGVFVDYNPKSRVTMKLGDNITTLDKTVGGNPDDIVTIYRGATANQKKIVPGDFITTDPRIAQSYTDGKILKMNVKKGDILDDITEPDFGQESIYRPGAYKELTTPYNQAKGVKKGELVENYAVAPTFEQDEEGNYRVTGAIPVGAGIKALKNGNIKFDGKYSKGDVGKVQAEIDKLLGYVKQKGKGTSVLGDGRKMLKDQIESFADTDPEARQIIDRVNELEDILADVSHTRTNPKVKIKSPENVKINPDLDHLMNYSRRLKDLGYKDQQIDRIGSKEAKRILSGQNPDEVIKIAKKQIGTGPEMDKKSLKQHWKKFYSDWVNALQPIEDLRNQAIKVGGKLKNDPKVAITRFLGAGGKAELRQKQNVQPVIDELSDLGISNSDFDIFLKAQRDIELGSRVDPVYGSDPVMARKVIESLSQKYDVSKMEELANRLYTYQNKLLAETRDAGFLTQDAFDNITASNQKYVPFDRIMDDIDDFIGLPTRSLQQGSQVIQKIKGSKRKILSPLESVIANTYKMESAIAKNRVAQSIASLKDVPGFENVIKEAKKSQTKGTISVWENGSKKYYQVPEDVVTAVKGLDEEQTNLVIEVLSAPARMLRQQATGRNLDFMIPNAFRDQFEASFNSKYGYRPFLDYFDGLRHWLNFKFKKSDDVVEEWINSGGSMFFENMEGRKAISQQISDAKQKRFTKKLYDWAVGGIDFIGDISEKPTRIGLYKRARKAGADTFESALESREGTLDFARRGARMKVANSIIPFLNVSVQGFDRYIRTWKSNPGASAIKTAVYAGTPALTLSLYNNLFHPEEYAEVPDFEKESNWIFLDGGVDANGDPTYLKLPKSHWQQYVSNPVDNLVTAVAGQNPQTFQQVALGVLSGMLPVVGEGNSMKEIVSRTVGGNLPQMFKPPIEALSNYSFFKGDKIDKIPDSKPPEEHYYSNTPDLYKYVGNVIQQSPLKIKNTVEGYAPLVKQAVNAIDSVDKISQGESPNINNIPIVRRFRGSRTGYDIDRPEEQKDTGDGFLSRLLKPTATTEASEGVKIAIPKDKEQFKEVYKQAQSKATGFSEKVNKIKYDPTLSKNEKEQKIQELREKTLPWAENYIKIQDQYPEQVFNMELDIYNKEGSKSTTDRASWAGSQIEKATTDEERENLISTLYDGQVLTKSVVEALNEQYDLGLTKYNYGDGFRYLSGGSGGSGSRKSKYKKLTSSNFKLPTIKIAQPKRYASRGISIGSNSGNSGGIKIGGFAPIKV